MNIVQNTSATPVTPARMLAWKSSLLENVHNLDISLHTCAYTEPCVAGVPKTIAIAAPGTGTSGSIEPSPGGDGKSVLVFAPQMLKDLTVT